MVLTVELRWCLYGIAFGVLLLAGIHQGIAKYRAKSIDFKAAAHLEALSTVSRRTRATIVLSKGTEIWTSIRKHFVLPALFGKRHLEPVSGLFTMPTRIQVLAVMLYIGINIIFLFVDYRSRAAGLNDM